MAATRGNTYWPLPDDWAAWWQSTSLAGRPVTAAGSIERLRQRYADDRRRLHAARVPLTYAIFLGFGAFATALELVSYPERRHLILPFYGLYGLICLATIALVRRRWTQTTMIAVLANNALDL